MLGLKLDVNMIYSHFTMTATFEAVRLKLHGERTFAMCSVECRCAFCYFKSMAQIVPIFTPTMTPRSDGDSPSLFLLTNDEPEIEHELQFQSLEEMTRFQTYFLDSMMFVESLVKRLDFTKYSLAEDLKSYNRETRCWQNCSAIIQSFGTGVLFQTHVYTGSGVKRGLNVPIKPSMFVSTRFKLPGAETRREHQYGFRIVPDVAKRDEYHVLICPSEKSMERWVMTLYYLICQSKLGDFEIDPPDWEKPVVEYEYEEEEVVEEEVAEKPAEKKPEEEYEYEYVMEEEEEVAEKKEEPVLKFEDDEAEEEARNEEEEKGEAKLEEGKKEEEDEEERKEEKVVNEERCAALMKLIETEVPVSVFAYVMAEQTKYTEDLTAMNKTIGKLEGMKNPVVAPEEFVMPVFKPVGDVRVDKGQTEGLLKMLDDVYDEEYEYTGLDAYEDIDAESLIAASLKEFEEASIVKFDQFFDFSNFAFVSAGSFIGLREPLNPFFIRLLSAVNSIVNEEPAAVSLSLGTRLVSMLAALLLNGKRGDLSLYTSLVELTTACEPIRPVVEQLSESDSPEKTAVSFVIEALNRNVMKIFLRDAHRSEDWERKYYLKSSLMRYGNVLETVLEQLSRLDVFQFALSGKFSDFDDVTKFVPEAFQFVEIEEDGVDVITFLEHAMENGLKKTISIGGSKVFDFMNELCEKHQRISDADIKELIEVFMSLRGDTIFDRKMKQSQKIHSFWTEGFHRKKLHIWFLFMVVDQDLVKKYYEEDASVADLYRANYIIVRLYHKMQSM